MKCQAFGMSWRERSAKDIWFKSHVRQCNCIVSHSRYLDSIATAHTNQQITNGMQKKWVFIYEWTGYESVGAIHKFIKTWTKFFFILVCVVFLSFVIIFNLLIAICRLLGLLNGLRQNLLHKKKLYAVLCILIFNETIFMNEKLRRTIAYGSTKRNKTKWNKFHWKSIWFCVINEELICKLEKYQKMALWSSVFSVFSPFLNGISNSQFIGIRKMKGPFDWCKKTKPISNGHMHHAKKNRVPFKRKC